jgi:hypothetical protein
MASGFRQSSLPGWISVVIVAVLTIGVAALAWYALNRADPGPPVPRASASADTSPPSPSSPSPEPSVAPTETAAPVVDPAAARVLTVGAGAQLWRAVAGSCESGAAPVVERSSDAGATWVDVTPGYLGVREVTDIRPFLGDQAELLGSVGAACERQALRTFTLGQFWEPDPATLAAWPVLEGAEVRAGATVLAAAPCETPSRLTASGDRAAVFCADGAWVTDDLGSGAWAPAPVPDVVAADADATGVIVAHLDPACAGVAVSRLEAGSAVGVGCAEGVTADGPVAVAASPTGAVVWAGDDVVDIR